MEVNGVGEMEVERGQQEKKKKSGRVGDNKKSSKGRKYFGMAKNARVKNTYWLGL